MMTSKTEWTPEPLFSRKKICLESVLILAKKQLFFSSFFSQGSLINGAPDVNEAPQFLADAVAAELPATPAPDKLKALRAKVAEARDLEFVKKDLEEQLTQTNIKITALLRKELPDLFSEVGVSAIELEPDGNQPGVTAKSEPYYKAAILASWTPEKRDDGFSCLKELGAEDLIKTVVEVSFPRGHYDEAVIFASAAQEQGMSVVLKEDVPWATLTAWLKEQVEKYNRIPPLDRIGGEVGRIVKIKPKKEH